MFLLPLDLSLHSSPGLGPLVHGLLCFLVASFLLEFTILVLENHSFKALLRQAVRWVVVEVTAAAFKSVLLQELLRLRFCPMRNCDTFHNAFLILVHFTGVVRKERGRVEGFKRLLPDSTLSLFKVNLVFPKTGLRRGCQCSLAHLILRDGDIVNTAHISEEEASLVWWRRPLELRLRFRLGLHDHLSLLFLLFLSVLRRCFLLLLWLF